MPNLASLASLNALLLRRTATTDNGLNCLPKLSLKFLYLEGTQVTEAAADQLRQLPGITVAQPHPAPDQ